MLRPGQAVDRYVVEDELGQGGMATVFRVRHEALGSLHALEVLRVEVPAVRRRLLQEGRTQASLRHPNIVAVTDVIEIEAQGQGRAQAQGRLTARGGCEEARAIFAGAFPRPEPAVARVEDPLR